MPLSIGPFPNQLQIGPCLFYDLCVSPTKVLRSIWAFFSRVALSFQWVPSHAGLLVNELADSPKPEQHYPFPMFPAHWPQSLHRLGIPATLLGDEIFHNSLFCQIPSVSSEMELTGPFPSRPL